MSVYEAAVEVREALAAGDGEPNRLAVRVFTGRYTDWVEAEVNAFLAGVGEGDVVRVGDAIPYRDHGGDRPHDAWSCTVVVRRLPQEPS